MKYICAIAETCPGRKRCPHAKPHDPYNWCDRNYRCYDMVDLAKQGNDVVGLLDKSNNDASIDEEIFGVTCIPLVSQPVKPKRKPRKSKPTYPQIVL
jgi:hypothetical protein